MKLSDFDFELPEALIATRPARPRSSARLLLAKGDQISDHHVRDLVEIFQPGDVLVLNNTKVIPARLSGTRRRGEAVAKVEITLLEATPKGWRALAKPLRKVLTGEEIVFSDQLSARVLAKTETDLELGFNLTGDDFDVALAAAGQMPLPPYIAAKRAADAADNDDYQTVFARHAGAVAAPTASLLTVAAQLLAGLATLKRNGAFAPYVAGEQLTLADLMFCFSVDLANAVGKKVLSIDFLADFPQAKALLQLMGENPHMARILADKEASMPAFMEMIRSGKR